MMHLYMNILLY